MLNGEGRENKEGFFFVFVGAGGLEPEIRERRRRGEEILFQDVLLTNNRGKAARVNNGEKAPIKGRGKYFESKNRYYSS